MLQSKAGYIDARPLTANSAKSTCNARPDHTSGSNSEVRRRNWRRPLFPQQRTSSARPVRSETCHKRTHAPQQIASLARSPRRQVRVPADCRDHPQITPGLSSIRSTRIEMSCTVLALIAITPVWTGWASILRRPILSIDGAANRCMTRAEFIADIATDQLEQRVRIGERRKR